MPRRRNRPARSTYLIGGRDQEDWTTDQLNVLAFHPALDDATPAFQRAIDQASYLASQVSDPTLGRGRDVIVPFRPEGYRITGLRMRSYVRLMGLGGIVPLLNPSTAGEHAIICDGADSEDGVCRRTTISNIGIRGAAGGGHGILYREHDNNYVREVRIKGCGGDGIHAEKKAGGSKSDGLVVAASWIDDNAGAGLLLDTNSHYCTVTDATRITNNAGGNLDVACVNFSMIGGAVSGSGGALIANSQGGVLLGVLFEGTPVTPAGASLLTIGHATRGPALGLVLSGCKMLTSGNSGAVSLLRAISCENLHVLGGHFDANSGSTVTAMELTSGAINTALDGLSHGGNTGAGLYVPLLNSGVGTIIR